MKVSTEPKGSDPPQSHGNTVYPFGELNKGEAFSVYPETILDALHCYRRVNSAMRLYQSRQAPKKFTIRILDDCVRVWRVE